MHLTKSDIEATEKIKRLNIINSISGIKPGNLIGTKSNDGKSNLAIFSSVVHLGSNPALLGFILRPTGDVPRHTYENILENGSYTINHIGQNFIKNAHYTASKYDRGVSEFERCQLGEEYLDGFAAPFVKESAIKMAMTHVQTVPIPINGTVMVIGQVEHLYLPEEAMDDKGHIDLSVANGIGIAGLNSYYALEKLDQFAFARPTENPFDV